MNTNLKKKKKRYESEFSKKYRTRALFGGVFGICVRYFYMDVGGQ